MQNENLFENTKRTLYENDTKNEQAREKLRNKLINELNEIVSHINSLREEIQQSISNFFTKVISKASNAYESLCQKYLDRASNWDNALGDFARNYNDMVEANTINADKYFSR